MVVLVQSGPVSLRRLITTCALQLQSFCGRAEIMCVAQPHGY